MSALTKHAKLAALETRGRTYVIAGLIVLPLVWSFVESWNSSYWGLLVALDVFVLAMCVFWNVREAFLPPVTIEELETLLGSSADEMRSDDEQQTRVAGTRGWYDNASDKVNFIVPVFVTLIFVAIQIIVLRAKVISVVILIFVSSFVCSAQQLQSLEQREKILVPKVFKNSRDETLLYRLFIPAHYDTTKKYPLVLYLHGGGGRGNDNRKQIDGGNGYLIDLFTGNNTQARYSSFVVAPQSPMQEGWIEDDTITPTRQLRLVYEMIRELLRTYKIDDARVYVAGQSMGGFGTLAIISEYPRLFAAGVVLCGGGDQAKVSRLANTPIWAFHGAKDESVPVERSRTIVAGIRNAGGQARYTEYADGDHLIWLKVVKESELLPWLFAQRR
jgi:predicted peptidase